MNDKLFDRKLYRMRRQRFYNEAVQSNFLHLEAEKIVMDTLAMMRRQFNSVWLYGVCYQLEPLSYGAQQVERFDLVERPGTQGLDEDELPFAIRPTYDLIISQLSLHMVNDLPGVLIRYKKMLQPGGLFIATIYGDDTLHELRDSMMHTDIQLLGGAAQRVIPFVDVRSAGVLLQRAGFTMPVAFTERYTVEYSGILALLRDIRQTGQANCMYQRHKVPLTRQYLQCLEHEYRVRYSSGDGLRCTYDIITMSGSLD